MTMITTRTLEGLSRYLDAVTSRQGAIAQNMANIDTPGYRTRDVDLRRAMSGEQKSVSREVSGLLQRPDGNNVSLEREGILMAETQLQFRTGVQLLRSEFRRILNAIQEGR